MLANNNPNTEAASNLKKPVLRRGSQGIAVTELQTLLKRWNAYWGENHGIFNEEVEYGVLLFQHWMFLKEDGIVGNFTWQALYAGAPQNMPLLKRGAQGELVTTIQNLLYMAGDFQENSNGIFGPRTEAAVRSFQRRFGLTVDGIVGAKTWYAFSKFRQQMEH